MKKIIGIIFALAFAGCVGLETTRDSRSQKYAEQNLLPEQGPGQPDMPKKRMWVMPIASDAVEINPESLKNIRADFIKDVIKKGIFIPFDEEKLAGEDRKSTKFLKQVRDLGLNGWIEIKITEFKVKRSTEPVGIIKKLSTKFSGKVHLKVFGTKGQTEIFDRIKDFEVEENDVRFAEKTSFAKWLNDNPEKIEKLFSDALNDFSPSLAQLLQKIQWEGRIAAIKGDRYYINVGQKTGLKPGDLLKVFKDGEDIFDAETGALMGRSQGQLKGTLEVVSYFGLDGAMAIMHSGAGFKENDRIEMY